MPLNFRFPRVIVFGLVCAISLASLDIPSTLAEPANLADNSFGAPGPTARAVLAQKTYNAAMRRGDPLLLLAAIRLATGIVAHEPTGWIMTASDSAATAPADGNAPAPDPAGPGALAIIRGLAVEDTALQDLVYDLEAQRPFRARTTVSRATTALVGGQTDTWRLALSGLAPAELGLIGNGSSALELRVFDDAGAVVCAHAPDAEPKLCRFTPARNGFFTVTVRNHGSGLNTYHLLGN